jgi:hypothetical protein
MQIISIRTEIQKSTLISGSTAYILYCYILLDVLYPFNIVINLLLNNKQVERAKLKFL